MPDHSEPKLATVLFPDLVDSTAAAGEQDPERTRARLDWHANQTEALVRFRNAAAG